MEWMTATAQSLLAFLSHVSSIFVPTVIAGFVGAFGNYWLTGRAEKKRKEAMQAHDILHFV
ncbi:hypothetical protein [Roseococcus suduntuyensis]|uniref:Uncharacterized protein n=1 Tax=Roseococcus suduntuyensis TaxID=455361 RepID=A0A840AF00_9PROT|nr:hypothetical protein [Roseococcus suduntuyensis]MBB3899472.1 hypothetical protein [Roseococcus suduntuyensis]